MPLPLHITELFMYAEEDDLESMRIAIEKGTSIDVKNEKGNTLLHVAIENEHEKFACALINTFGANPNFLGQYGATPLHLAAEYQSLVVAKALIQAKANINAKDRDGFTPLYFAIAEQNFEIIDTFITAKADVNTQDNDGETPLHTAVMIGNKKICLQLLAAGADTTIKNKEGLTPAELAIKENHQSLCPILKSPQTKGIVESNSIATYTSGIVAVIFNTFDRDTSYHRENRETYIFSNGKNESCTISIPELKDHLIPKKIYIISELQEKDQIIFYYTPEELLRLK